MKIMKTVFRLQDEDVYAFCDAIKFNDKLWLVPDWIDEGATASRPARLISIDSLEFRAGPIPNFHSHIDFAIMDRLPKSLFDPAVEPPEQFEVIEAPDITIDFSDVRTIH